MKCLFCVIIWRKSIRENTSSTTIFSLMRLYMIKSWHSWTKSLITVKLWYPKLFWRDKNKEARLPTSKNSKVEITSVEWRLPIYLLTDMSIRSLPFNNYIRLLIHNHILIYKFHLDLIGLQFSSTLCIIVLEKSGYA